MKQTVFIGFPKISRLSRECVITEKIDGTNRWNEDNKPPCCRVVPVMYSGIFDSAHVEYCLEWKGKRHD